MAEKFYEVELEDQDSYNRVAYVHNLQANNKARLSFSRLPKLTLEESIEYFGKALKHYLEDNFFCETELKEYFKNPEFMEVAGATGLYMIKLKDKNKK